MLARSWAGVCVSGSRRFATAAAPLSLSGNAFPGTNPDKAPVCFVHGFLGSASNFRTVAKAVAEQTGRSTYTVSVRNHGDSPWSDDMSNSAMAGDVLKFMEDKARVPAVLVGHSMGGKIVMHAALERPDAVQRVVSVDMSPISYSVKAPSTRTVGGVYKGVRTIDMSTVTSKKEVDEHLAKHCPEPLVRMFVMQNVVRDGDKGFKWRINVEGITPWLVPLLGFQDPPSTQSTVPATFIAGGDSDYCLQDHMPTINQFFQDATFTAIPGAGHYVHAEKQPEFLRVLVDVLNADDSP